MPIETVIEWLLVSVSVYTCVLCFLSCLQKRHITCLALDSCQLPILVGACTGITFHLAFWASLLNLVTTINKHEH